MWSDPEGWPPLKPVRGGRRNMFHISSPHSPEPTEPTEPTELPIRAQHRPNLRVQRGTGGRVDPVCTR